MVEVAGKIVEQPISILIDPSSTHSYITHGIVEMCTLKKSKNRRSWLVQLATGTKKKDSEVVKRCPLVIDGLVTCVDMNVFPLGSYDILIGMIGQKHIEKSLIVTTRLLNALMKKETQEL